MYKGYRVGVIIPALNEAQSVKQVIIDIQTLSQSNRLVVDEIVLCDNGSTDETETPAPRNGTIGLEPASF